MTHVPNPRLVEFWEAYMAQIITSVVQGTYRLSLINDRFQNNNRLISARYKRILNVTMSILACQDQFGGEGSLPQGCRIVDGEPQVVLFVPTLIEVMAHLKRKHPGSYREVFETALVVGTIHETDHLAMGLAEEGDALSTLNDEQRVWAETCEHTIRPLVEIYHEPICASDMMYYQAWVKAGRNVESSEWRTFIRKLYRRVKKHNG
jgi:hypothetical protein